MALLLRNLRKRRANLVNLNKVALDMLQVAMDSRVGPALVKSHNLVVANWQHKPGFEARTQIRSDVIITTVYPTGENSQIYLYVDQGTRPHEIKPVRAKMLRFVTGYQPKTLARPARTVGGGGKATGDEVFAKVVHHPGTEAREFSATIAEDIKPGFNKTIDNAFRQIARAVEE